MKPRRTKLTEWMFFECLAVKLYDKSKSPRGLIVTLQKNLWFPHSIQAHRLRQRCYTEMHSRFLPQRLVFAAFPGFPLNIFIGFCSSSKRITLYCDGLWYNHIIRSVQVKLLKYCSTFIFQFLIKQF